MSQWQYFNSKKKNEISVTKVCSSMEPKSVPSSDQQPFVLSVLFVYTKNATF